MTQCWRRWCCRWHDRQCRALRPCSPTTARSSVRVPWAAWNRPRQSAWPPSRRQKSEQRQASRAACGSTPPRSLLPPVVCAPGKPVNHGWAGFQSVDDPVVAPPFASFRDIGLQQDPRLQYPARRALSFPNQGFKPFAFLAAQPHNILLYRNLLRSHDCLLASRWRRKRIPPLKKWKPSAPSFSSASGGGRPKMIFNLAATNPATTPQPSTNIPRSVRRRSPQVTL